MILLLCAVLFCVPFVRASLPSLNDTCIHTPDSSACSPCNTRTSWDIISSCCLTLFACTWTAIHPNIPGVGVGVVRITFYRLCLMIVVLFAPEIMIMLAVSQFVLAQKAAKKFNDTFGWTLTHGFFVCMGGFVLDVHGRRRVTLEPDLLLRLVKEGSVQMPTITEAEIEDRSKGDWISKCVAVLQLVWFIIQLIARYAQGLPVTLFEIDTLGVAALACIAYGFWWKKPKDVRCPYVVYVNSGVTSPRLDKLSRRSTRNPFKMLFEICRYPINTLWIILIVSGMIFGGIHCLDWNYLFQTHKEQILWRAASLGVAFSLLLGSMITWISMDSTGIMAFLGIYLGIYGCTCFYLFSRITIFVLMFLSLRSLPPGACDTVAWTKFITHVTL